MAGSLYNFAKYDGLRPEDISRFSTRRFFDLIQNPTRLGERILPFVQTEDWAQAVGQLSFRPVASAVIAPDSVLPRGPLGTYRAVTFDILKVGRKYALNESEIRKLRDIFFASQRPTPDQIFRSRPYNLANALVVGYLDLAEAMRWEVLQTGSYQIRGGSTGGIVNYGLDNSHKVTISTSADQWNTAATADGLDDIQAWDDILFTDTGVHASMIVMSTKQLNNLLAQETTKERLAISGLAGLGGQLAATATQKALTFFADQLNAYLARRSIGPVVTYDRMYNLMDEAGNTQPTSTRFLADDRVVMIAPTPIDGGGLIPGGTSVGYQADGPVVENNFRPGLHVWMTEKDEPYEVEMKSAAWTLPILTDPRTVLNAKVQ